MKKCSICGEYKDLNCYAFNNQLLGKVKAECKECTSKRQKEHRLNNIEAVKLKDKVKYQESKEARVAYARKYRAMYKDRTRTTNLKSKYGITNEDYLRMKDSQLGCCAICGTHESDLKRILCIDHCHNTNFVRGLLCDTCNKFLGFYEKYNEECRLYVATPPAKDFIFDLMNKELARDNSNSYSVST